MQRHKFIKFVCWPLLLGIVFFLLTTNGFVNYGQVKVIIIPDILNKDHIELVTMKKIFVSIVGICLLSSFQVEKMRDMVPDAPTAIKIAEAVWLPIYGKQVLEEKPFKAELEGDSVWVVHGSLPKSYNIKNIVHVTHGGVAHCIIRKKDGTILKVIHYK